MSVKRFGEMLEGFSCCTGRFAAWLFIPLVLLTTGVSLLRYGFSFGNVAAQEAITYLHAFIITLGVGYTWKKDAHVRVDIFYKDFSFKKKLLSNLMGDLFLLIPVCIGILVISWGYAGSAWASWEGSREAGGLPLVFILKSLIPVMAGLLLLQAAANVIRQIMQWRSW